MWNTETPAYKPKNKGLGGIKLSSPPTCEIYSLQPCFYKIVGIV